MAGHPRGHTGTHAKRVRDTDQRLSISLAGTYTPSQAAREGDHNVTLVELIVSAFSPCLAT